MKFVLAILLLLQTNGAIAKVRTDCSNWEKNLKDITELSGEKLITFKKDKSLEDLLLLIQKYPDAIPFSVETRGSETHKQAVDRVYSTESCLDLTYFDIVKRVFNDQKISSSQKKKFLNELFSRIAREDQTSLISILTRTKLITMAIENKILKLSNVEYFEIGSILSQIQTSMNQIRVENESLDKKPDAEALYKNLNSEIKNNTILDQKLIWWVKRVQQL